jgi:hypothetical protein
VDAIGQHPEQPILRIIQVGRFRRPVGEQDGADAQADAGEQRGDPDRPPGDAEGRGDDQAVAGQDRVSWARAASTAPTGVFRRTAPLVEPRRETALLPPPDSASRRGGLQPLSRRV